MITGPEVTDDRPYQKGREDDSKGDAGWMIQYEMGKDAGRMIQD